MRIVFDPDEQEALRADARDRAQDDPRLAYVLERLASEGVDLEECAPWDELREQYGLPELDEQGRPVDGTPHVA